MTTTSRRSLIGGTLGLAGTWLLGACTSPAPPRPSPSPLPPRPFPTPTPLTPASGGSVIEKTLRAAPATIDLGGTLVDTWAYADTVPGPTIEANVGDLVRITLDNQLPADTTIHWHGIALTNPADGVPGLTQNPVAPGGQYLYEFVAPDPGTYFFHPHVGVQLDRGLYAPLTITDPAEPGGHDAEWVVVLDDWLDGTGRTPDDVLRDLTSAPSASPGGMGGMDHSSMGTPPFGDAGDVTYP
ncbi:MAG: multicopper oxidase domain-containing protein, partial [Propionicimonas sp.]|nr:multicopper oxidase domain-containing protein [Propionicimonas sp.]